MVRKLFIDTDPGVDDAMAIFMALASKELDVVGLSTVFGNANSDVATNNALLLLEAAGRTDIPVARGARQPLERSYIGPVPQVHGENGLGEVAIVTASTSVVEVNAADLLHSVAAAYPGEVTLVALGPLTNLAHALEAHPDLVDLVAEVVVMGGNALGPGNATPVAEANINNDPEAADIVFGAAWHVTMVGLDVTHNVNMSGEVLARIMGGGSAANAMLSRAIPHYQTFYEATNGIDGIFVHDPSTIAYVLRPDLFETQAWAIRVETESFSRGKTWPNLGNTDEPTPPAWTGRPTVDVCVGVDGPGVVALIEGLLS